MAFQEPEDAATAFVDVPEHVDVSSAVRAQANNDFFAIDPDDLTFQSGQVLYVLERDDSGMRMIINDVYISECRRRYLIGYRRVSYITTLKYE